MLKELTNAMIEEKKLFEELIEVVKEQKVAMIERDLDKMAKLSEKMEEVLFEIDKIDNERHKLFNMYKRMIGLDENSSFDDILNNIGGEDREVFVDSAGDFLMVLNELAAELQGMKEMMEFERSYFDFVMSLLSEDSGKGVYSNDGKSYSDAWRKVLDVRW